jgi:hypothetical protein
MNESWDFVPPWWFVFYYVLVLRFPWLGIGLVACVLMLLAGWLHDKWKCRPRKEYREIP